MTTRILIKKVSELEQRVATLERVVPRRKPVTHPEVVVPRYTLSSYQALARLKGILKGANGEDPVRYQRRIRKESERFFV